MLAETLKLFFLQLKDVFLNFNFLSDTLDIIVVAIIVYGVIVQMRKTQAIQVVKGIVLVGIVYGIVSLIGMNTSSFLFSRLFNDIIIIFVIIFNAEIRQTLEHLGKRKFGSRFLIFGQADVENVDAINAVCRAAGAMSRNKVGSLILFQRNTLLGDLTKQAVPIDSETTFEMICSIFYPKAPLHDGAVIIKDGRIVAARCVVPMKNDREITENVGTRHRAALEASLNSDAIAVVTSEETGIISVAADGQFIRGITDSQLREILGGYLLVDDSDKKSRKNKKKNKKQDNNSDAAHVKDEKAQPENNDMPAEEPTSQEINEAVSENPAEPPENAVDENASGADIPVKEEQSDENN